MLEAEQHYSTSSGVHRRPGIGDALVVGTMRLYLDL